jgi:signal transduction histidine kinase
MPFPAEGAAVLNWLLQNDFMPHGHCYYWRPDILWTHVLSDGIIALSYFSIPITLLYFLRRRPDVPFPAMIALFAAFIVLCGAGHVLEIWTVWQPIYALQGLEKAATAAVSLITAAAMVPLVPKALAMRTPAELQHEIDKAVGRLRETQDQLVQNEKMASLGALVAGVSHEINTPVGVSVTAASSLHRWAQRARQQHQGAALTPAELDEFLIVAQESSEVILRNLQRAADLIQSFKQVAVDQASSERRQFSLRGYLDEVLLSLGPQLKKTPHRVAVDCPDTLVIDSYPGALAQILTNLVINTLVHAFPEGRAGTIRIAARELAGFIHVEYADDGVGMPPENLKRIFDPFFTTRRGSGGSGLGMHIVYNLVTQTLGGTVAVASAPGEGLQVRIVLPVAVERAAA